MTVDTLPEPTAPVRLLMVTADNNNKYYNMTPSGDSFLAEWGRVDVTRSAKSFPISKWYSVYKEKTKKGYKDVTKLVKVSSVKREHVPIKDPVIDNLLNTLMGFSKASIKENYSISSDAVTQAQVTEAQAFLDELTKLTTPDVLVSNVDKFNKLLLEVYTVIPRRMSNVRDHLLKIGPNFDGLNAARKLVDSEQKTLDVMAGQVQMNTAEVSDDGNIPDKTILDVLGISVELADAIDIATVRNLMGSDANELKSVYRVIHHNSRNRYNIHLNSAGNKKEELFWHGSRNENWISILQTGLKIRPSNAVLTGAMFGHGIYFADKYRKSANYSSLSGSYWARGSANTAFLALMDVHVGNQLVLSRHNHECYNYNKEVLLRKGKYDSLFAKGGADLRNNEYIVYDDAQSTIKYLIQVGK